MKQLNLFLLLLATIHVVPSFAQQWNYQNGAINTTNYVGLFNPNPKHPIQIGNKFGIGDSYLTYNTKAELQGPNWVMVNVEPNKATCSLYMNEWYLSMFVGAPVPASTPVNMKERFRLNTDGRIFMGNITQDLLNNHSPWGYSLYVTDGILTERLRVLTKNS